MSSIKNRIQISGGLLTFFFGVWLWQQKISPPKPIAEPRKNVEPAQAERLLKVAGHQLASDAQQSTPGTETAAEIARKSSAMLKILDEILISKNDNDPRLDSVFRNLSPLQKQALKDKYNTIIPENRNERGTLVFLLGRELESTSDFNFLKQVVAEAPCQSLSNCTSINPTARSHDEGSGEIDITLEYPQIVAIKALETYLTHHPKTPAIEAILTEAIHSKNPLTRRLALSLNQKY
jgi:hypothetical protein